MQQPRNFISWDTANLSLAGLKHIQKILLRSLSTYHMADDTQAQEEDSQITTKPTGTYPDVICARSEPQAI